jgi:hypothetical protein
MSVWDEAFEEVMINGGECGGVGGYLRSWRQTAKRGEPVFVLLKDPRSAPLNGERHVPRIPMPELQKVDQGARTSSPPQCAVSILSLVVSPASAGVASVFAAQAVWSVGAGYVHEQELR